MGNHPFVTLLTSAVLGLFLLFACKSKDPAGHGAVVAPIQSEIRQCVKRQCVAEDQCANFVVHFPQFSGGDSATTAAISYSVQSFILSTVGGDASLPFEVALDSAGINFCAQFMEAQLDNPDMTMGFDFNLVTNVLAQNARIMTLEMSGSTFTGNAHPNMFSTLVTYDLQNKGQVLPVTALVSDTTAVLPLLEKAYKASKGMPEKGNLSELLYEGMTQLPLPKNIAILSEGIRFYYNDYEVAPHAIGPADLVLTWAELGPLADQKKWF